jgi:hypothetical protein
MGRAGRQSAVLGALVSEARVRGPPRRQVPAGVIRRRPSPATVGRGHGRGSMRGGAGEGAGLGWLARAGQKGGGGPISKKNPFLFYFQI